MGLRRLRDFAKNSSGLRNRTCILSFLIKKRQFANAQTRVSFQLAVLWIKVGTKNVKFRLPSSKTFVRYSDIVNFNFPFDPTAYLRRIRSIMD